MIFKSSCYHPRLTVYERPLLTETIVNCVQDIVYTWATEALGGQGRAALIKVWGAERASLLLQEMSEDQTKAGKAAAPARSCAAVYCG